MNRFQDIIQCIIKPPLSHSSNINFCVSPKVLAPPGYGQDVKSWSAPPAVATDPIKDASKVFLKQISRNKQPCKRGFL